MKWGTAGWIATALAGSLACGGCLTLDAFLFDPVPVEAYLWDEADPQLDGELTDPHPSLVDAAHRMEGFAEAEGKRVHWVYAHQDAPAPTILYSHGRARNLGRYWDRVELLWGLGFEVLIYDYPGYGRSEGQPSERGVLASAMAAGEALQGLRADPGAPVFLYGYSLGGTPALELALRADEVGFVAGGVLTESAFCSVGELVEDGAFLELPADLLTSDDFDACRRIGALPSTLPKRILHGEADDFVLPRHAELLEARAVGDAEAWVVPGGQHSDLPVVLGEGYGEWVAAWAAGTP
jgi:hypothetical protein